MKNEKKTEIPMIQEPPEDEREVFYPSMKTKYTAAMMHRNAAAWFQ